MLLFKYLTIGFGALGAVGASVFGIAKMCSSSKTIASKVDKLNELNTESTETILPKPKLPEPPTSSAKPMDGVAEEKPILELEDKSMPEDKGVETEKLENEHESQGPKPKFQMKSVVDVPYFNPWIRKMKIFLDIINALKSKSHALEQDDLEAVEDNLEILEKASKLNSEPEESPTEESEMFEEM